MKQPCSTLFPVSWFLRHPNLLGLGLASLEMWLHRCFYSWYFGIPCTETLWEQLSVTDLYHGFQFSEIQYNSWIAPMYFCYRTKGIPEDVLIATHAFARYCVILNVHGTDLVQYTVPVGIPRSCTAGKREEPWNKQHFGQTRLSAAITVS